MKPVFFLGDSLSRLREFPPDARSEAGHQILQVQKGNDPADWKPFSTVGPGVREIRVREESGAFRTLYLVTIGAAVVVLHAFQKKAQKTSQRDIALATSRLRAWRDE